MNSFGNIFRLTTFGESHGKGVGGVVDGMPAGIEIDTAYIQQELDRRRPGQSSIVTARKESDSVEILSGVFEGRTTGTPIGFVVYNQDQHSSDYDNLRACYRPSHADYTYTMKYGLRDHRGGGRSSARETLSRCVAGALAKAALAHLGIRTDSFEEKYRIRMDMFQRLFNPRAILALARSGLKEYEIERLKLLQSLRQGLMVISSKDLNRRMLIFPHTPIRLLRRFAIRLERDALDIGSIRSEIKRRNAGWRTDLQEMFRLKVIDDPKKQLSVRTFDFPTYSWKSLIDQLSSNQFDIIIAVKAPTLVNNARNQREGKRGMYAKPFAIAQETVKENRFPPRVFLWKQIHFPNLNLSAKIRKKAKAKQENFFLYRRKLACTKIFSLRIVDICISLG